jgi:glycosyltransferase involved in cell wall biosynthesis
MKKDTLVSILIPTWDNQEYLSGALTSLLQNQSTVGLMRIIVINNGHPNSCDWVQNKQVTVIQTGGKNLGWEGGIDLGLKHTTSEFVCFFNDDAYIPNSSKIWLNRLLQSFKDPKVGAVGPSSNCVMGAQNIWFNTGGYAQFYVPYLVGFCVVVRRSAFNEIGGIDLNLPSGDDLDWSIRLRDAGYKLVVDKEVFVYHHGFKSGNRLMGDHQTTGGWNSYEMQFKTNTNLIKKHGLKKWWETVKGWSPNPETDLLKIIQDSEGNVIREMITDQDHQIYDLGCGNNKTINRAIGVDMIAGGKKISTLAGVPVSQADIVANVANDLPIEEGSADIIIARHILEHCIDPLFTIQMWINKLKKGGKLILALPNQNWHSTIPMNSEHVHAYTPESAHRLLEAFNLKNVEVKDSNNGIGFVISGERQ